jgi:hypothetical protein
MGSRIEQSSSPAGLYPRGLRAPEVLAFVDEPSLLQPLVNAVPALVQLIMESRSAGVQAGLRQLELLAKQRDRRQSFTPVFAKLGADTSKLSPSQFDTLTQDFVAALPSRIRQNALQASHGAKTPAAAAMQQAQRFELKAIARRRDLPVVWPTVVKLDASPSTRKSIQQIATQANTAATLRAAKLPVPAGPTEPKRPPRPAQLRWRSHTASASACSRGAHTKAGNAQSAAQSAGPRRHGIAHGAHTAAA